MKNSRRKAWEIAIGKILKKNSNMERLKSKPFDIMQSKAEKALNPNNYQLSEAAKKRLKWMYVANFECGGNIALASRKISISRVWLSLIHSKWEKSGRDPRSLEPNSRAPKNTDKRKRIDFKIENKIVAVRNKYYWGKDKLETVLKRDYGIAVGATTINRYLNKHGLIDVKISQRIKTAHKNKVERKQKCRPPTEIKDYKPGALVEKDMKFIVRLGAFRYTEKYKAKENFWNQHTLIDTFTRIRTIGLAADGESKTAVAVQEECEKRLPFKIACANTDNGSENEKDFDEYLIKNDIMHFYSRSGTPTDNPRVERSHLTDEMEFYQHGNICKTFAEQKKRLAAWEYRYNYVRPHQALGNLTPMEFYELWKTSPDEAYKIAENWKKCLKKQSARLANSRKMKSREKIAKLMEQIDRKLANN
jgi:transposase InsO family protein